MTLPKPSLDDVRALIAESCCVAAVIDPLIHSRMLTKAKMDLMEQIILSSDSAADHFKSDLPRLIHLKDNDEPSALLLEAIGEGQGMFLTARRGCTFMAIADTASRLCHTVLPDGCMAWFRWYEPYIFDSIFPTLNAEQLGHVFGDAIHAFWVASDIPDTFTMYGRPDFPDKTPMDYLHLNPEQIELLEQAHFQFYIDELTHFVRQKYEVLQRDDYWTCRTKIAYYVQIAESCGFVTMDHMSRFVEHVLTVGEQCLYSADFEHLSHMTNDSQKDKIDFWEAYCRTGATIQ